MRWGPVTVVETREFDRHAADLLTPQDRAELIEFVAYHPRAGVVIPGTGGVRKLRWRTAGHGKRGGARVVYLYHNDDMPIFLFTIYGKPAQDDLRPRERAALRGVVSELIAHYGREAT